MLEVILVVCDNRRLTFSETLSGFLRPFLKYLISLFLICVIWPNTEIISANFPADGNSCCYKDPRIKWKVLPKETVNTTHDHTNHCQSMQWRRGHIMVSNKRHQIAIILSALKYKKRSRNSFRRRGIFDRISLLSS